MQGRLGAYVRFLRGLPAFLNTPMAFEQARESIVRRLERREENFLSLVKRTVYENSSSPYLRLLEHAQCTWQDMEEGVRRHGLEGFLRQLKDAGVWVSLEEFKGAGEIRRGALTVPVKAGDLGNPLMSAGCEVKSGGTSGRTSRTRLDLDFRGERANYAHLIFKMLDICDVPLALWYPRLPAATGIGNSLVYARIGHPPERWFCMLPDSKVKPGIEHRLATDATVLISRFTRNRLARPEPVSISQVGIVLDWMVGRLRSRGRCVLQTYVSQAVRVSQAAARSGLDMSGALFIVGSEPLSVAKYREIESVGAKVYPRYHASEFGVVGVGCGCPREVGEYHLAGDSIAVIQDQGGGTEPTALYLTSLLPTAPVISINVELGDRAVVDEGRCGCQWEEIGLTTHLRRVSSFRRSKTEGMTVSARALSRVVEEVLPARYGGSSVDYQWIEEEDGSSFTRLWLRIDPRVGPLNEAEMVDVILAELRPVEGGSLAAEMWRQAQTIRVLREPPLATSSGKVLPWLRRQASGPQAGATA